MSSPTTSERRIRRALLCMVLAALLFSLMALAAKRATLRLPGPEVAFLRFLFGLLVLPGLLLGGWRPRPHNLWALFLRGAFGGGAVLLYFLSLAHLPIGVATLLNYSFPVFTILFSALFLQERLARTAVLALGLTCAGVTLVVKGAVGLSGLGPRALPYLAAGLCASVLSGAAVTTIRGMRRREGSWEIFIAFCLIGALCTSVPTARHFVPPRGLDWLPVGVVGLCSVVAQLLMTFALRDLPASTAGLLLQITPVTTVLGGTLWLGERPSLLGWGGAALTLLGVSLCLLPEAQQNPV